MPVCHLRPWTALAVLGFAAIGTGCYKVPAGKSAVDDVSIKGTHDIDVEDDLEERLATRESSRFLGIFSGVVYEYETFDRHALQRDLARIERYLRARGFYDARVQAARVVANGDRVRVTVEIEQGPATVVESLLVFGASDKVRDAIADDVKQVLPIGAPLDEDKLAEAETVAVKALTSRGHALAKVERSAEVDLATHKARLSFKVTPGRIVKYGPVKFEGLAELPEDAVRRVFGVEEGEQYDSSQLDDARQGLLDLGVFASVDVVIDKEEAEKTGVTPVVVKCEVSKLRSVTVGIGAEFDSIKTDGHLVGGWQSSNWLGGLRKLDVRFKPGIVLYPTRARLPIAEPDHFLYDQRLNATLRQPALFEKRLTGVGYAEYAVYPVLLPDPTPTVLGYHELRGEVGVERPFGKLFVAPKYGLQANIPFDYVGETGNVDTLKISYVDLNIYLDYRDNALKPRKGFWIGGDFQRAGSVLQGDADDLKMQPEVRAYIPLPKKVVLALRASTGFLFPFNYRKDERTVVEGGSASAAARDYQLLFFRGFFGGGPTSNRGYPLRAIGPHDVIPFLSPAGQSGLAGSCDPKEPKCTLPTGGLSLWEANAEIRFIVADALSGAVFCDSGDVSKERVDIRLDRPHLSCGGGMRYDTPVGPIRLDVGYRIPGLQNGDEPPPAELFGAPIAVAIALGEAF